MARFLAGIRLLAGAVPGLSGTAAFLVVLLAGCAAHPPAGAPPGPTLRGTSVAVLDFETTGVQSPDGEADIGRALAEDVASQLRRLGFEATLIEAAAVRDGAVVRGRVLRVDGGSGWLRFLVGFGAGRARLAVEGRVVRPDGTELARFRVQRSASGEPQLGLAPGEMLLDLCRQAVARDIAEMIDSGQYREEDIGAS